MEKFITSEFIDDFNFYVTTPRIPFQEYFDFYEQIEKIKLQIPEDGKFVINVNHETLNDENTFKLLIEFLEEYPLAKISCSTSTKFYKGIYPLVNMNMFHQTKERIDINSEIREFSMITEDNFNTFDKNNKGILSCRKKNPVRDKVFELVDKDNFEGYLSYAAWTTPGDNSFLTTPEIYQLYVNSYTSFVVESDFLHSPIMNPMTEKTILAFSSKTIPIVLGGRGYIKELEELGFKTFNKEFGFGDADLLLDNDMLRMEYFNKCIDTYNSMSYDDIVKFYNDNIHHIENNFKIIEQILFKNHLYIL